MATSEKFPNYMRSKTRKPNGIYSHTQIPNCAAGKYGGSYYILMMIMILFWKNIINMFL